MSSSSLIESGRQSKITITRSEESNQEEEENITENGNAEKIVVNKIENKSSEQTREEEEETKSKLSSNNSSSLINGEQLIVEGNEFNDSESIGSNIDPNKEFKLKAIKSTAKEQYLENDKTLKSFIERLKKLYNDAIISPEDVTKINNLENGGIPDRLSFDAALNEIVLHFNEMENNYSTDITSLRQDLTILRKDKEVKIREWKERYDKLQSRWNETMANLDDLQFEKEELRKERDSLFFMKKSISNTESENISMSDMWKSFKQSKEFKDTMVKQKLEHIKSFFNNLLLAMTETLASQIGIIYIFQPKTNELRSFSIANNIGNSNEKNIKKIVIPSNQGITGDVFSKGIPVNAFDSYSYKRFNKTIDRMAGIKTKTVVSYPLFSQKKNATIGVLEMLNKTNGKEQFDIQDEARMTEFSFIISHLIDSEIDYFQNIGSRSRKPSNNNSVEGSSPREDKKKMLKSGRHKSTTRVVDGNDDSELGVIEKLREKNDSLIPKDIEDYIKKLEACWRRAVGETAQLRNTYTKSERELSEKQNRISFLDKKVTELEHLAEELKTKLISETKDHKALKNEWKTKESELKQEVEEYKRTSQQLMAEQAKRGKEDNTKTLNLPISSANSLSRTYVNVADKKIELPYLDMKHQNKKVIISLSPKKEPSSNTLLSNNTPVSDSVESTNNNNNLEIERQKHNEEIPQTKNAFVPVFSNAVINTLISLPPLFHELFVQLPIAAVLLTKKHRIWRVNTKFTSLVECTNEQTLIGLHFSDICVGIDEESLPKLLQFDIVQGLGITKCEEVGNLLIGGSSSTFSTITPNHNENNQKKRVFVKVNAHIGKIGLSGQKFVTTTSTNVPPKVMKAPFYCILLYKVKSQNN
ncbi:hypothetical protein ABK040_014020 [Willaertia magna]